jgi:hypothetical protein
MMAADRQLDEKIRSWLEADAPGQLPDRVLSATFVRTRESGQQGGWQRFRWSLTANWFGSAFAATAVVVIGVMVAGIYFNQPGINGRPGAEASASPSESATPGTTEPAPTPTAADTPTAAPTATENGTAAPTLAPTAAPTAGLFAWSSQSANEDWPAPLRVEQPGSGVEAVARVSSQWVQYTDAQADTTPGDVSAVDISTIHIGLGCVGGEPKLRCLELSLAGQLPDPIPQPQDAWYGYGIVLDVDSDGVPDYRYGVDNFNTGLGPCDGPIGSCTTMPGRLWRADLRTGQVEVVAVPQADDNTLAGEFPTLDFPSAGFHIKNLGGRFYAWASLISDGRVVATDYAPNVGWLELVNK